MAGSITGLEILDRFVARLVAVGKLAEDGPAIVTAAIAEIAKEDMTIGRSPNGRIFDPRKADGKPALANAPAHVTFRAEGSNVVESAPDHYKYHRTGTRKMVKRNVFAEGGRLPPSWRRAAELALKKEARKRWKG